MTDRNENLLLNRKKTLEHAQDQFLTKQLERADLQVHSVLCKRMTDKEINQGIMRNHEELLTGNYKTGDYNAF